MVLLDPSRRSIAVSPTSTLPAIAQRSEDIGIRSRKTDCATCHVRQLCLPMELPSDALVEFGALVSRQTRYRKGDSLYRPGEPFTALYAIRIGSCKTTVLAEDGREQICGYHMLGDIIGLDGIGAECYACEAVTLEDTEVCALPFDRLEALARKSPLLQHTLHRYLSAGIGRRQNAMLALGSLRAEERLAWFLLNLSDRYRQRGYSSTVFVLRMTRQDIGSYLGLKLETISRLFSRLQAAGVLQTQGRVVKLLDLSALKTLAGHHC